MSDSAEIPQTETPVAAPESQPAQGGDTPAAPAPAEAAAPAASQQPQMIPKWRFDEVNEQLKAMRQQQPQQAQPQKPTAAEPQAPRQEDFNTWEEYVRADARFVAQQEARQEFQRARQAEQQQAQSQKWSERVETAETKFSEKLYEATAKNPALIQKLQNAPFLRGDLQLALKESDAPIALAEHLADNPVLVLQLNQMAPDRAWREMGRIEAKLAGSTGQPPPRKPSAGVPDMQPVGAGNKPGAIDPYDPNTSTEDYVRLTRPPPKRR